MSSAVGRGASQQHKAKSSVEVRRVFKPLLPKTPKVFINPQSGSILHHGGVFVGQGLCYICGNKLSKGYHLVNSCFDPKKASLPSKIGQIMGDSFVIVVKDDDVICERCHLLMVYMDTLERELVQIKKTLREFLGNKYEYRKDNSCDEKKEGSAINEALFSKVLPLMKKAVSVESGWARNYNQSAGKTNASPIKHPTPVTRAAHKCTMCEDEYDSWKSLKDHKILAHLSTWTCHFCNESFADQCAFTSHTKQHLSETAGPVHAAKTPAVATAARNVDEAANQTTEPANEPKDVVFQFSCEVCHHHFLQENDYIEHMQSHGDELISMDLFSKAAELPPGEPCQELEPSGASDDLIQLFDGSDPSIENLNMFVCANCEAPFKTLAELTDHFITAHDMQQCSECPGVVGTKLEINAHTLQEHQTTLSEAEEVSETPGSAEAGSENTVQDDMMTDPLAEEALEADDDLVCQQCGGTADCQESLDLHKEQCDHAKANVDSLTCGICGALAESKEILSIHLETCGQLTQVDVSTFADTSQEDFKEEVLDVAEVEFHDESETEDGMWGEVEEVETEAETDANDELHEDMVVTSAPKKPRTVVCNACGQFFSSKAELFAHEQELPEHLVLQCPDCNEQFSREKELNRHREETHERFSCRHCYKSFQGLKPLKAHEMRHVKGRGIYICASEGCNRIFLTQTGLRNHQSEHTGDFSFYCEFCKKGFVSKARYEEHRAGHTKEKRYTCDICDRQFSVQGTYWIHRKWHDDPKPYKCHDCGTKFKHSSLLAVHKRKHTGERPYQCQYCSQSFLVSSSLKRHVTLHTRVYPYTCTICDVGFPAKHKMAQHMSKVHNDDKMLQEQAQNKSRKMVMALSKEETEKPADDWGLPGSAQLLTLEISDADGQRIQLADIQDPQLVEIVMDQQQMQLS